MDKAAYQDHHSAPFSGIQDPSQLSEECHFRLPPLTFALQALLARHEALMASAENERYEMQTRIDQLEMDKKSLEAENARTIQENRALLDKLEELNDCVVDSETQIKTLEANLRSTQRCVREMESAEVRASDLESQVHLLETEQAELQHTLVTTQAEARSAMTRWRKAEKGITDLQEKLEVIEKEAREERDRHTEMCNRMEKQRNMEKDLNAAAGRLKGAAAARNLGDGKNGGVVSHFVRDLLSDNANLQLGIAELRELLVNSNDEIQHLREQLMFHQPLSDGDGSVATTLRAELEPEEVDPKTPRSPQSPTRPEATVSSVSQELHIHHHYHVARPSETKKTLRKKRPGLNHPNAFMAPRPFSPPGPASPAQWRLEHRATSPAFVGHSVKDSISTIPSGRWSVFSDQPSDFAPSSAPSSPMSHCRNLSLADRDGYDAPISPTAPSSPAWTRQHRHQSPDSRMRKFSTPRPLYLGDVPEDGPHEGQMVSPGPTRTPKFARHSRSTTLDHTPDLLSSNTTPNDTGCNSASGAPTTPMNTSFDDIYTGSPRPRLRRTASQDSIMSLSGGLDIHTLKDRPSQLALRPLGIVSAETELSAVVARPTIARGNTDGKRGSMVLRDNLLSLPNLKSPPPAQAPRQASASSLGRLVSWRPWGQKENNNSSSNATLSADPDQQTESGSTTAPSEDEQSVTSNPATLSPATESPGSSIMEVTVTGILETPTKKKKPLFAPPIASSRDTVLSPPRSFGINQAGAIPGFSAYWAAHQMKGPRTQVVPQSVDAEALREGLQEL